MVITTSFEGAGTVPAACRLAPDLIQLASATAGRFMYPRDPFTNPHGVSQRLLKVSAQHSKEPSVTGLSHPRLLRRNSLFVQRQCVKQASCSTPC